MLWGLVFLSLDIAHQMKFSSLHSKPNKSFNEKTKVFFGIIYPLSHSSLDDKDIVETS